MKYLSLFSGIEAATQAWKPLGWAPFGFAEIEKFPSAVLAHHYGSNMPGDPLASNGVPNFGDVSKFKEWPDGSVDVVCGGSPCQSFSVAGLRKGLDDPRGNLIFSFLGVVEKYRPNWVIYENVPGILSSNGGRDFGSFVGALAKLGYGWSYRVLDAQYIRVDRFRRAVPQRRRRVVLVGYSGDWRRAAAVLFERESLSGNPPPRRKSGQETAADVAPSLVGSGRGVERTGETLGQDPVVAFDKQAIGEYGDGIVGSTMAARDYKDPTDLVAHSLRGEGFDASEGGSSRSYVADQWAVRRLTPVECERLMGFPDNFTQIPWRGKDPENCPDGPRYKALGNSWAVNMFAWVGQRIDTVQKMIDEGTI